VPGGAPPATSSRLLAAGAAGLAVSLASLWYQSQPGSDVSDFSQLWYAASRFASGSNPYDGHVPVPQSSPAFGLMYPMPALIVVAPLALVAEHLANAIFVGLGAAVLAFGLTGRTWRNPRLLVFLSFAVLHAIQTAQWSMLLTGAALIPSLGWLLVCKPTIGLALWISSPTRTAAAGAAVFLLLTILLWPWWLQEWIANATAASHMSAPVMRWWGGPLLLLALWHWRYRDARLLVALSCVPQTPVLYEAVPLFLLVTRHEEGMVLVAMTMVVQTASVGLGPYESCDAWMQTSGLLMLYLLYLPCLVMVLWRHRARRSRVAMDPATRMRPDASVAPSGRGRASRLTQVGYRWDQIEGRAISQR
jgi:hypothetical protein